MAEAEIQKDPKLELALKDCKRVLNIAVIGHVDSGKSTLTGQLLLQTGYFTSRQLDKNKLEAEQLGKATFELAFFTDKLAEEKKRGITIQAKQIEFNTEKRYIVLIDCPGHKNFIKNFTIGSAQANCVILMIDVKKGIEPQTIEHLKIVATKGIESIIVAVNKIDSADYSQAKFNEIAEKARLLSQKISIKAENIFCVPTSAFKNDNITTKSLNTPWYSGPTILELLDIVPLPQSKAHLPFRMVVSDLKNIPGVGLIVTGTVTSGYLDIRKLSPKDKDVEVLVKPRGFRGGIKSIEAFKHKQEIVLDGYSIGMQIKGLTSANVKPGFVICDPKVPVPAVTSFKARIKVVEPKTHIRELSDLQIVVNTSMVATKVKKIYCLVNDKNEPIKNDKGEVIIPSVINPGETAEVELVPSKVIAIEPSALNTGIGIFNSLGGNSVIAKGNCLSCTLDQSELEA